MKMKAIQLNQNGNQLYVGVAKAGELAGRVTVDMRSGLNQNGYQRECSLSRARSFGRFISRAKGVSPNTILLNVRNQGAIQFKDGLLTIDEKEPVWLVDGQHRVKGLQIVMEEDSVANLGDFEIPVMLMNQGKGGEDNYMEAKQFWIVNKTQKGVRADLAERILQRAVFEEGKRSLIQQSEQGILGSLLRGFEWKEKAIAIADILQKRPDSPWRNMIRMPNEPKAGTVSSQKAFTDSIEPILKDGFFASKDKDAVAQVLINFWNAAKNTWPEVFDTPEDYALLKTTGVNAMHISLPTISSYCVDKEGKRVLTKQNLVTVIAKLAASGITEDFWSSKGEAGRFGSGKKSQRLLADMLIEKLVGEVGPASDLEV